MNAAKEASAFIPTRRSLLSRLKNWDDAESWRDFFDTYWRLIYSVAIKAGLNDAEAQDVVQETVLSVARRMPNFKYDPAVGSFKSWLLLITRRRIADHFRKRRRGDARCEPIPDNASETAFLERVLDPAGGDLEAVWAAEWDKNILDRAIDRVKRKVDPKQFQIFDCYVLKEWPVKEIRRILGVSDSQVYLAKHRINSLVKKEIQHLETKF
jgi:RNA polymerase sigma factor (sigma-70 family)